MKFELPGSVGDRHPEVERNALSSVVYDLATRQGYTGDAFRDQYRLLKDNLGALQQPAPTPAARAALRDFAAQIINANQEPAVDPAVGQATLPTSGEGAPVFDPAKFQGGGNG